MRTKRHARPARSMHVVAAFVCLCLLVCASLSACVRVSASPTPVVVGVLVAADSAAAYDAPCLAAGSALVSPLNASLLAIAQLNAAGGAWSYTLRVESVGAAATPAQFAAALTQLANDGVKYVVDWDMDADARRVVSPVLRAWNMHLWSSRSSLEECDSSVFSVGSTPNVAVSPSVGWIVTRRPDALYFLLTATAANADRSTLAQEGASMRTIVTEQLRWSGGTLLSSASIDVDSDLSVSAAAIVSSLAAAVAAQSVVSPEVIVLSMLPDGSRAHNELLSAMLSAGLTAAARYAVVALSYDESQAWQFLCAHPAVNDTLKVYSAAGYFHSVDNAANAALIADSAAAFAVPSPIWSERAAATYTAIKLLASAITAANSADPLLVATFARSAALSAPEGSVRMSLSHHLSRHTRLGLVRWDSGAATAAISVAFESQRVRRPAVWNAYLSPGLECDWSDATRGASYEISSVRVGILHSVTGALAFSERSVVDAELLAIDEINEAGGVLGKTIIPVFHDGATDWPRFADKAALLCADPNITSVFGCWTSVSRKYVLPVFEAADKLLWYPVQYEGQECSRNVFYTGAAPNQQIEPSLDWLLRHRPNQTDFFLVGSDYVFPRTANAVIKAYLATMQRRTRIVGERYIPLTGITRADIDAAVDDILDEVRTNMPEGGIIYNTLNGDSNIVWFRRMAALGMSSAQWPTMSVSIAETEIDAIGKEYLLGHYASWDYFQSVGNAGSELIDDPSDAPSANALFVSSFKGAHGMDRVTNDPMEAAYIAVWIWKQAAEQAGVIDVTKLRAAAYGQVFDAPEGLVTMNSNHHLSKFVRIGRVNADGQFDIVSGREVTVTPQPWSQLINTTTGHRCDWSRGESFYEYPSLHIAVLVGFAPPHTLAERSNLDAVTLAVQQANRRDPVLPGYTIDVKVMDDGGDVDIAEANLQAALRNTRMAAVFVTSPSVHSVLAAPSASMAATLASSSTLISATRVSTSSASGCSANLLHSGATLNQLVEPALRHLLDQGRSNFVLLLPDAALSISSGLQLVPSQIQAYVTAVLAPHAVSVRTVVSGVSAASMTAHVQWVLMAHPAKATLLNFLPPDAESALLFQAIYDLSVSTTRYPVLSFTMDAAHVRSIVADSPAGQQLFTGHSFAAAWSLEPGSRDASDLLLSIREAHSADAVVTPTMDAAYSAVSAWSSAVRLSGSIASDRVRQLAYLTGSGDQSSSTAGADSVRPNNCFGKYFHIAKLGRNGAFQVLYPTNGAALLIEPRPFHLQSGLSASDIGCDFGPKEVTLDFSSMLKRVIYAIASLVCALVLGVMALTHHFRATPIIRKISPLFCLLTQSSLLLLAVSGLIFTMEPSASNGVCVARVWCPTLAVSFFCTCLFAKMWRLHCIFNNVKVQVVSMPDSKLLKYVAVVNAPLIMVLMLWSAISTPAYQPMRSLSDSTYSTVALLPACSSSSAFFSVIVCFLLVLLVVGLALSWRTRHVPEEFGESRYVSMCIVLVLFFALMLIPLNYLLDSAAPTLSTINTLMLIRSIGVLFASVALGLTLFLPFFVQLSESEAASGGSSGSKGASKGKGTGGLTRLHQKDSAANYANTSTAGNTFTHVQALTTTAPPAAAALSPASSGAVVIHVHKTHEGGAAAMRSAAVAPGTRAAADRKSTVVGSPSTAAVASVAPRDRRSASKQIWAPGSEQPQQLQQPLAQRQSGLKLRMSSSTSPPPPHHSPLTLAVRSPSMIDAGHGIAEEHQPTVAVESEPTDVSAMLPHLASSSEFDAGAAAASATVEGVADGSPEAGPLDATDKLV